MKKVNDAKEFFTTINRYGRLISNDYMLPGAAEKLIANGKLHIEEREASVFLYEEREGCYKFSFRINKKFDMCNDSAGNVKSLPADESIFIRGGSVLSAFTVNGTVPKEADQWLTANGFKLLQERVRYTAKGLTFAPPLTASNDKIEIVSASVAYPIYRECFDMRIADLPCPELFEGAFCVRGSDGAPAGVLSLGADRHIAVLPGYRGQGVAMRLYAMLAAHLSAAKTERLFADVDNPASNGLYKKLGFKRDGVVLRCYVRGS